MGFDNERVEYREVSCTDVKAGARNSEVLVQHREGEFACTCC